METLYFDGPILTMLDGRKRVEALLVRDGIIVGKGWREEMLRLSDETPEMVDLKGSTLLPAFIDAHSHLSFLAYTQAMVDLTDSKDFQEI
ncbi:hypothetical protein CL176_06040 [Suicoccus acidiformans]|uniref:Amidohydrolase 3 domain-containing protein n=1 Tax=Suicoccus acidiformans TaxID=2036206 RepID=A0A347WKI2_9LACT|nr:hypothetical protein [Suicoccus acidiformans]AXY25589.1 hypothetical protein CL176_06040 [Suicoccus acidiformans]